MFRFFRKHGWILIVTLGLTILSFVLFMGKGSLRGGNGSAGGNLGTIYGKTITPQLFEQVKAEFAITYWLEHQEWPDKNPSITSFQLDQQVYEYLLMQIKAESLGIHVGDDAAANLADQILRDPTLMRAFSTSQPVSADQFVQYLKNAAGYSAADFERSVRARIAINQLVDALGLPGVLMTPQEAGAMYDREFQEVSAQAVFFSASNYLSQIRTSPAAVEGFYSNNIAAYREPDRVQIRYVAFNMSNYLDKAKVELTKTNLDDMVQAAYDKYGTTEFASEKSPEAAKAKIREMLIQRRAFADAGAQANDFVSVLYAMNPAKPENLAALAKQKNLTVYTSAPFSESTGPEDFDAPASLTQAAFQLSADSPYTGPIAGSDAIYVIALANQLPSSIPSFEQIRTRVTHDYEMAQAVGLAQRLGTNFDFQASVQMAAGKRFSQVAAAQGVEVVAMTPFSLSSSEVPELDNRADLAELKRAAFTTAPGRISQFFPTEEGGFILHVESLLPIDQSKKATDFPKYLAQARRARENEAFNLWLSGEMNRELRNTAFYQEEQAAQAK
jgi:hypothetical protein